MTNLPRYLGVVLSGGRSSRMGQNKALLPLGEQTLLERTLARLACQLPDTAMSTAHDSTSLQATGLIQIADKASFADLGPLSGILAAMDYAKHQYKAIITVAVDTPFFPLDYVERLTQAAKDAEERPVMAASDTTLHPTFSLWPVSLLKALETHLSGNKRSVLSFAEKVGAKIVSFTAPPPYDYDPFFNINTPEDFAMAQILLQQIGDQKL